MYGHLRIRSPWTQLALLLGITGAAYIFSGLALVLVLQAKGIQVLSIDKLDWNNPSIVQLFKILQAFSSVLIFFIPAFLFSMITFRGKYFYFLGLRKSQRLNMYVLAVMCIFLAFPFVFWLGNLNQQISLPQWMTSLEKDAGKQMEAFLKANNSWDITVNVLIIALLPAICEELFFRGALQRIIIQIVRKPLPGIILSGIVFSVLHMQFQGFLPRMFLGIVLGFFYWYSGSLWTSILAHFVNNAVQVVAVSVAPEYSNENPVIPFYAALVSGIAVWAILYYYRKQSASSYARVYETNEVNPYNQFLA